ncbi:MAG: hypothetical protein ACKVQB_00495 [Bacteroidia bacterium]
MRIFKNFYKIGFLSIWFLMPLLISRCSKESVCPGSVRAEFKNFEGVDGCGWIIQLKNGSNLEPTNLSEFGITPKDGKKIWINFHEISAASICMVGKIVEIDCIAER